MKINVNGREVSVGTGENLTLGDSPEVGAHLSYEEIVQQAGYNPARILSVTYKTRRSGDEQRQGILSPGAAVRIEDGMVFNVADTSGA